MNLVVLDRLAFECSVEGYTPVRRAEHDIYILVRGEFVLRDKIGEVITLSREQELMKLLGRREVYATEEDKRFHYDGR